MAPLGRALVFIGFMGAGKSTAAEEAAADICDPLDSDRLLEARFGHSIAREFELHGEAAFRAHEEQLVCELLAEAGRDSVIALGGGAVLSARVREALKRHVTVLLDIGAQEAWERVNASSGAERPLARDKEAFCALHSSRRGLYESLADAILPASAPAGVAGRALDALLQLRTAPPGTRLLWASAASGEYPVMVGCGLLKVVALPIPTSHTEETPDVWPFDRPASRAFCVTDETVARLYAWRLGLLQALIAIPPGESHKTLASAERIWRELAREGMTRADHLVALGGGVVGDLAGFCAATYQRGVPVVHVPTTLVAQVDSAYGGKTGVDLPEAKNYVGAYHQPAAVLVDPDALDTLPEAELAAGWAEVLKTALIAGGDLWERVAAGEEIDEQMILACARLKLAVVAEDERDAGRRQVLNLGHTVGHAIEAATGYARYRHGEAVGLGLLAALRLSGQDELREQVRGMLRERGLPVRLGDAVPAEEAKRGEGSFASAGHTRVEEIVAAIAHDKKRTGAHTPFVLVRAPGDVRVGCEVAADEVRAAVAELVS